MRNWARVALVARGSRLSDGWGEGVSRIRLGCFFEDPVGGLDWIVTAEVCREVCPSVESISVSFATYWVMTSFRIDLAGRSSWVILWQGCLGMWHFWRSLFSECR